MKRWWIDEDRDGSFAEAVRAYVERDVETDGLAAAIFRCKLISLGFDQAQSCRLIAEHGMERRRRALPAGTVAFGGRK